MHPRLVMHIRPSSLYYVLAHETAIHQCLWWNMSACPKPLEGQDKVIYSRRNSTSYIQELVPRLVVLRAAKLTIMEPVQIPAA